MASPSTIEELQRRVEEAVRQADEARRLREEAERRAEESKRQREEAQRLREEAEQQRLQEQRLWEHTTLTEYLEASHKFVFTKFAVKTDKNLTTQGSTTSPRNTWRPARLSPWSGFLAEQGAVFETLLSVFPAESGAFESRGFLRDLGKRESWKQVANEKNLEYFWRISIDDPIHFILKRIVQEDAVKHEFDVGSRIVFDNYPNGISDVAKEVVYRRATRPPSTFVEARPNVGHVRPDQICVYRYDEGGSKARSMAYVVAYRAPHKLTPQYLRLGLRQMNIYDDIVHRAIMPAAKDEEAVFQYHADKLVVAAVTQTFHYMIEGGLEYGLLTTGDTFVFLKIDWADPTTLYYHLAEPGPEVHAHPDALCYCTAVGQLLAFSLMALGPPGQRREHGQDERESAMKRLNTWTEDYEAILQAIPIDQRKAPPTSPACQPRTYGDTDRSPCLLRGRAHQRTLAEGSATDSVATRRPPGSSDAESDTQMPGTPSPTSHTGKDRGDQFCTRKCLLGLLRQEVLDEKCPNVALHRGQKGGVRHPVDHAEWLRLLSEQLKQTLDEGVTRLWKQGARGALFQVTLLEYGYTFVAKGTVPEYVEDLEHEAAVYHRLQPVQGIYVPVFLGSVGLRNLGRTYYYDHRVRIVHAMFLSWAGDRLDEAGVAEAMGEDPAREVVRSVHGLHAHGVAHTDVRKPNVLWCRETRRAMMIDFERAVRMEPPRPRLGQIVPNKRA